MNIRYTFSLEGGLQKRFELSLEPKTLSLTPGLGSGGGREAAAGARPPEWARLGNEQCSNCPLPEEAHPFCPVAVNLVDVIEQFKDHISFREADISIVTEQREYRKRASLQSGISGLIGVIMVTSGCPILDMLRPMVRTHLPFSSSRETTYRAISMYLTAQYLLYKRGRTPDWDLKDLVGIYDAVSTVNRHFSKRLRTIEIEDASLNALVGLDCFAVITIDAILGQSLDDIEGLFHAYLSR